MDSHIVLLSIPLAIGAFITIYNLYYVITALFGLKKETHAPAAPPRTRFAVLVAARNEVGVVGQLIDSLQAQSYPKHLYDVIVAPNNCTDDTAAVAEAHGALLFAPRLPVRSKGEVLRQLVDHVLSAQTYDAICVFDADNLVHPAFLQKMNDARLAGARAAQCFRDSKNPAGSAVATCHSIGFWVAGWLYTGGLNALGMSSLMNGSGIMVDCGLLRAAGGWHTHTITEDYEFTAKAALLGERVHYVPGAITYDEQPLTLAQSWTQRRRWSSGHVQCMQTLLPALAARAAGQHDRVCADLALMFASPLMTAVSCFSGVLSAAVLLLRLAAGDVSALAALAGLLGMLVAAYLCCTGLALFVARTFLPRGLSGAWRGILLFAPFLLTCAPITLLSLVKRQKVWKPIAHTSAISMRDLAA